MSAQVLDRPARHLKPRPARRSLLAPEVVQTSSMDCGPAALKCLLEGHGVPVSYGRLREACQTDVDGTSIDTIEVVAQQLGLAAEQVMVPVDHVLLGSLPAIVVVRHVDSATHFVVVWRRLGNWLQVMDPAIGRRWVRTARFMDEVYRHRLPVPAEAWHAAAAEPAFGQALLARLRALGVPAAHAQDWLASALAHTRWRAVAALDAAVRMVAALQAAGGVRHGDESARLVQALVSRSLAAADGLGPIPALYWSVTPAEGDTLLLQGAVVLHAAGLHAASRPGVGGRAGQAGGAGEADQAGGPGGATPPLSAELAAALAEKPEHVLVTVWRLMRQDGLVAPLALAGAVALAAGVLCFEALLFRGLFDISAMLGLASQRAAAVAGLLAFLLLMLALEWPVMAEGLRQGRQLEARLRMALLAKLPRLSDRYFQSRPLSDMADRSHGLQATRGLPGLAQQLVHALVEAALTLAGVLLLAPASAGLALALFGAALLLPLATQPMLNERDLRARNHAAALNGFYLDALLGLVPVRAHRAERNVAQQHESLLVAWALAARSGLRVGLAANGLQGLACIGLAGGLLLTHFARAGQIGGADLLLVFWVLKLPALGGQFATLAQQYPAQRNVLMRLMEPLAAPEPGAGLPAASLSAGASSAAHASGAPSPAAAANTLHAIDASKLAAQRTSGPMALRIEAGQVLAAGHEILRGVDLTIAPGEQVAIVGVSGAGKSSLLGLLLGWHRLAEGRLLVDGQAQGPADDAARRRVTAWVDPAVQLWNRSLLDNLAYASDGQDLSRIGPVLQAARLRGVLQRLPQGLQSLLGEGGALLSGGEGQRVRLARALLATEARLVLLDEPFRGLDRPQRQALLAEARQWWQGTTLLCVTHDVGETLGFDRVLVVEDGRIVEDGAPHSLDAQASRYRDLLQAERAVQATLWQGPQWRRIAVRGGRVSAQAHDDASGDTASGDTA